jgi:EmrB/QacA subfamily drug resistance transporter
VSEPAPNSIAIAFAVSAALFMHLADTYALATVLPVLAEEFGVSPIRLKYTLTVYLFVSAIMIPASGWIADRWGSRKVFFFSVIGFLSGSVLCALSGSVTELVMARALQGVGGGIMVPVARLIVVRSSDRSELVRSLNWFTIPAILGPLIAPPIAGVLAEHASWRWVFLINLPIGLIGMGLVLALVPKLRHPSPGKFDFKGVALIGCAILGVMLVADTAGTGVLSGLAFLTLLFTTILLITLAIRYARRSAKPVLDFRLFSVPSYRAALLGGGLLRLSLGATPFLLPILLQTGFGWSPSAVGWVFLSAASGAMLGRVFALPIIARIGFRSLLVGSAGCAALLVMIPASYSISTPVPLIFLVAMSANIFFTIHYAASNALVFADVPEHLTNAASTLSVVAQQVTQSLGISLGALVLFLSSQSTGGEIQADSFLFPFLILGGAGLLALPVYLSLPASVAGDMRGAKR